MLLAGERASLDVGEDAGNDDEKSNVGRTNDWDGSTLSIVISNPVPSFPSEELRSLILSSSLPISEEADEESEKGVADSERIS